jgi:hypothetical protein
MPRLLISLLLMMFVVAGCGGDEKSDRAGGGGGKSSEKSSDERCAAGEGDLEVADVLPEAPSGHEVVTADREKLRPLLDPLRKALGGRLRGFKVKAVVPKGEELGTAVVIANVSEDIGDPEDVLKGAKQSAKEQKGRYEEISAAGAKAAFVDYGDVFQVSVPLGKCSVGTLIDQDEKRIRAVAGALKEPST